MRPSMSRWPASPALATTRVSDANGSKVRLQGTYCRSSPGQTSGDGSGQLPPLDLGLASLESLRCDDQNFDNFLGNVDYMINDYLSSNL
jgi:hypothetical protein